ncbi:hypothetical protein ASD04_07010 [Devosia sp. Root436]|uniref:hypothetical protein n=1 Tax=Devosia sp. Root436 TaxID=1736537 RepID=UPI0007000FD3|nr:hypothetical protein [Devosia sp. Root436]KQX40372.1 hypothetical protein ASD04_07010 [Devosia sp. Root436]
MSNELMIADARRRHVDAKAKRLETVGSVIPVDWDRAVEAAWPTIWGAYRCGLPGGWVDLVLAFSEHLAEIAPLVWVEDSKEKYGGMRVDLTGDLTEEAQALAEVYESLSEHVCQDCGEPGRLREDRAWYATLCDRHAVVREPT